jgi:hypothetical protein
MKARKRSNLWWRRPRSWGNERGGKALTSTLRKIVTFSLNESFGGSSVNPAYFKADTAKLILYRGELKLCWGKS